MSGTARSTSMISTTRPFVAGSRSAATTIRTRSQEHFTQVVWRGYQENGVRPQHMFDSVRKHRQALWACEYDPPGNFNANQPGAQPERTEAAAGLATRVLNAGSATQTTTAIISDVDLYDIPGGVGKVIGVLS